MSPNRSNVEIRPLAARDSIEALTTLLHVSYAPLAALGMNYPAATQLPEVTARRAAEGQCFVAVRAGDLVGTVTVAGPQGDSVAPWFRDADTAHLHQFAVSPTFQGRGIGHRLVAAGEQWAVERRYRRTAIDTPIGAERLRTLYRGMGYGDVGEVQWPGENYRSIVMCKMLDESPLRAHLLTMARYNLWATTRLLDAVDALSDAEYRAPAGLFFGSIHGTLNHLLVGEHLLWRRRFAEGESPVVALDHEAEPDRARLRQRLLEGAAEWLPLMQTWMDARLAGTLTYRRMTGQTVTLPFAAALLHVFNHGTHHRGQISAAITALGRPCPELDLVILLQQESVGR